MKLYKLDSKNKTRFWQAEIQGDKIVISYGLEGSGKVQHKERSISPKNVGRANETTIEQQGLKDLESLVSAQKDKGYVEDISSYTPPFKPMLAHKYKASLVDWQEAYASTKLDGIRCFIILKDGKVEYMSRSGKPFKNFLHITEELLKFSPPTPCVLDGELFNRSLPFNEISSRVNSETYEERDKLIEFHMYDFILLDHLQQTFPDRLDRFWHAVEEPFSYIKFVEQVPVASEEEMLELFSEHIAEGYEGTMIKSNAPYVFGKRSNSLLKYKEMEEAEFLILDVVESEQDPRKPKIVLSLPNGSSFSTGTVRGDKESVYQKYLVNKQDVIGKWLTVRYQTLSSYGVPLFPVGIGIREGEVVDGQFVPLS